MVKYTHLAWAWPLETLYAEGVYLTVNPSSRPNTDTVHLTVDCCKQQIHFRISLGRRDIIAGRRRHSEDIVAGRGNHSPGDKSNLI